MEPKRYSISVLTVVHQFRNKLASHLQASVLKYIGSIVATEPATRLCDPSCPSLVAIKTLWQAWLEHFWKP